MDKMKEEMKKLRKRSSKVRKPRLFKEEGVKYNGLTLASLKRMIVHESELYRAVCILQKALFTIDQIRDC